MDAFTIAMLSLLAFFTIVTFGSLYLYNKHNQNRADQ
ncbi:putative membrane protein [Vibrio cholerae]|nr:putative membrane protein [Vibrio cholerae]